MRTQLNKLKILSVAVFVGGVVTSPSLYAQEPMQMAPKPGATNSPGSGSTKNGTPPVSDPIAAEAASPAATSFPQGPGMNRNGAEGVADGLRMMGASGQAGGMEAGMPSTPAKAGEAANQEKFSQDPSSLPDARPMEIVEISDGALLTLTAAPARQKVEGTWIRRLGFNGSVPGPVIKVKQGSTVRLVVVNRTDVETTLHPHGIRTDEKNDGVVGIGQSAIEPGKSYEYTLTFPDAGMFWYHAHVHEDYTQDAGLYGNFWVVPNDGNFYNKVNREVPLLIDDVQVGATAEPYYRERATHTLTGRFGDVMLINGSSEFAMAATQGEVVRIFLTNAANTRTFAVRIPGLRMKLVGGDNGLYERETWRDSVTIGPSERYIVEVMFPKVGTFEIVNEKPVGPPTRLGKVIVSEGHAKKLPVSFETLRAPAAAAAALKDVKAKLSIPVTHELRLDVSLAQPAMPMPAAPIAASPDKSGDRAKERGIEWEDEMASMNAASDDKNVIWKLVEDATKQENMDIKWTFRKGEFVKIRLFNDPKSEHPMQHPIHFHGQRFVIAAINGKAVDNLVWKDTVLVPEGDKIDIVLELSNVGRWLAHCHIAEHLSAGMVMGFTVLDNTPPSPKSH